MTSKPARCSHPQHQLVGPFTTERGSRWYAWCCKCGALGYRYGEGDRRIWWKPGAPGNRGDWFFGKEPK